MINCKKMERYKNSGGNSGIRSYEISADSIVIEFSDGGRYLYNYQRTGSDNVERMKSLAVNGRGLNSFISTVIKQRYASKLR
jgi:hypothetical protein